MMPPAVVSQRARSLTVEGGDGAVHLVHTVLLNPESGTLSVDEHIRVRCSPPTRWSALGDVLIAPGAGAGRAARLAGSCPGALVVAVHRGTRCWLRPGRDGPVIPFEARGPGRPHGMWDRIASLAHACLVAGLPVPDLGPALAACALRAPDGLTVPTRRAPEPRAGA
ncbi:hypothetical protein [Streptomyces sp. NPDC060275]|uniref:hypothetical protein n=1 Tax=Streptomyces sp. NPDC060275 TaxID=3347090 RepID=UPI003660F14F